MNNDWQELTALTQDRGFVIERVRLVESEICIGGRFELPLLARLSAEDQVFVAVFVRSHGSIKQMEHLFGVSYPTIKSRLNRIASQLESVEIKTVPMGTDALGMLERGEITVDQAVEMLGP